MVNGLVGLEKTLESPLDCKEMSPVYTRCNQSWIFIGRTDDDTPIFWPTDAKNWLSGKDPDAEKDWRQEEKGMTENDGWMASPTWWTWVWASSESWWWTGRPGVLQFTGLQEVSHNWATELNWRAQNSQEKKNTQKRLQYCLSATSLLNIFVNLSSTPGCCCLKWISQISEVAQNGKNKN